MLLTPLETQAYNCEYQSIARSVAEFPRGAPPRLRRVAMKAFARPWGPASVLLGLTAAFGFIAVSIAVPAAQAPATPAAASVKPVTFTKDVAPILQRSCQNCHRPDQMAPMSLLTYE